jgi:anhydro-N-acetylmuramic acid kinase
MNLKTSTNHYKVIGLMSGTSLDGLDIAACNFSYNNNLWLYEIAAAETIEYPAELLNTLTNAHTFAGIDLIAAHHSYGNYLGAAALSFCKKYGYNPHFIASHGHTIFHQPNKGFSFQLGSGANIAVASGFKTVSDFRSMDVAAGGQGAPLVPIGDELLFKEYAVCVNLGGILNLSYQQNNTRLAYDLCCCNMALNYLSAQLNKPYDAGGKIAAGGVMNAQLLTQLMALHTTNNHPSLGREWFEQLVKPIIDNTFDNVANKMFAICQYIAQLLAQETKHLAGNMMLTGGGAYNQFLVNCIKQHNNLNVIIPPNLIVEFKEAMIFAFLGVLRIREEINCLKSVTQAPYNSCSGAIYG